MPAAACQQRWAGGLGQERAPGALGSFSRTQDKARPGVGMYVRQKHDHATGTGGSHCNENNNANMPEHCKKKRKCEQKKRKGREGKCNSKLKEGNRGNPSNWVSTKQAGSRLWARWFWLPTKRIKKIVARKTNYVPKRQIHSEWPGEGMTPRQPMRKERWVASGVAPDTGRPPVGRCWQAGPPASVS